jgi:hypothetical protein
MKILILLVGWFILFVVSWPLALLALLALLVWPLVWLASLPLALVGIAVRAVFALIKAILFLPARILGYRS